MTDVSALEGYAGQLSEAAAKATAVADIQHRVVHGNEQTDVLTEGGLVPSLAKQAVLSQQKVTVALETVASQLAGAMIYATVAAGLAGTNNKGFFSVPSASADGYVDLYMNDAGTAVYQDTWANGNKVKALSEGVEDIDFKTKNISGRYIPGKPIYMGDGFGGVAWWMDDYGNTHSLAHNTLKHIVGGILQIPQTFRRVRGKVMGLFGSDDLPLILLHKSGQLDVAKLNVVHELLLDGKPFDPGASGGASVNLNDMYRRDGELLKYHANPLSVSGWGSSSMERMGAQFAAMVGALEPNATYYNGGKGGEQSTHIAARLGSIPLRVTVEGGAIPASGAVTVTASNARPSASLKAYTGWLNGVHGTMRATSSIFYFTRTEGGAAVTAAGEFEFKPEIGPQHRSDVVFLWMGKNDVGVYTAEEVIERTDKSFEWLSPFNPRCLVLGHFNNSNWDPASTDTKRVAAINAAHKARYGDLYIDVQAFLLSSEVWTLTGITPTAEDLQQQARGQKPNSLSVDDGHMNEAMYIALNEHVIQPRIRQLGWY